MDNEEDKRLIFYAKTNKQHEVEVWCKNRGFDYEVEQVEKYYEIETGLLHDNQPRGWIGKDWHFMPFAKFTFSKLSDACMFKLGKV